jgi:hypothetical protein
MMIDEPVNVKLNIKCNCRKKPEELKDTKESSELQLGLSFWLNIKLTHLQL